MNQQDLINDFFLSNSVSISFTSFLLKLVLATVFSLILGFGYHKYSSQITPSNRYYSYIALLTVIVTIIIGVVKGSLALSLGLVGALSIVRFRTAIKDPGELLIFFSAIAVGISLGADQIMVAFMSTLFIFAYYFVSFKLRTRKTLDDCDILVFRFQDNTAIQTVIIDIQESIPSDLVIKSIDITNSSLELIVETSNITQENMQTMQNKFSKNYSDFELKMITKTM